MAKNIENHDDEYFYNILGATTGYLFKTISKGKKDVTFFKEYNSKRNFLERMISAITAPFASLLLSVVSLIFTIFYTLIAIICLSENMKCIINKFFERLNDEDKPINHNDYDYGKMAQSCAISTAVLFLGAILSPLGNLIDFIGSTIITISNEISPCLSYK